MFKDKYYFIHLEKTGYELLLGKFLDQRSVADPGTIQFFKSLDPGWQKKSGS